ncbi:hypothetical protein IQ06DRAFT_290218 [Phaeosphaeriaceae sp. SRC1lsM3a]|nr:hypothetical protein IQ06DRAFT_290218 [Stagonospora sp. SRC1lsM3a]
MSVTTTANPLHYSLETVLTDYHLHHSEEEELDTSLNTHPAPTTSGQNPSSWPTEHRRVPAYRPVNRELDQSERRVYLSGVEQVFVGVMFTGVFIVWTISKIWRGSFGRVWNVEYKVGGEW